MGGYTSAGQGKVENVGIHFYSFVLSDEDKDEPRDCWRNQGRQRTRWRDEIRAFAGAGWSTLTSNREQGRMLGEALVLQMSSNG